MRRFSNLHFGSLLLALAIAVFLWGIAHGSSSIERAFNISVEIHGVKDSLVVTDQSADDINVRVAGSRAALRNLSPAKLKYLVDVSGQKPGVGEYEVELSEFGEDAHTFKVVVADRPLNSEGNGTDFPEGSDGLLDTYQWTLKLDSPGSGYCKVGGNE